jgi:hypothetical protein
VLLLDGRKDSLVGLFFIYVRYCWIYLLLLLVFVAVLFTKYLGRDG